MTQHIYGGSDDLIEATGDVTEEWDAALSDPTVVEVDGGVRLSWEYGKNDSAWRVEVLERGNRTVTVTEALDPDDEQALIADEDGCPPYSDKVTIAGDVEWVECRGRREHRS